VHFSLAKKDIIYADILEHLDGTLVWICTTCAHHNVEEKLRCEACGILPDRFSVEGAKNNHAYHMQSLGCVLVSPSTACVRPRKHDAIANLARGIRRGSAWDMGIKKVMSPAAFARVMATLPPPLPKRCSSQSVKSSNSPSSSSSSKSSTESSSSSSSGSSSTLTPSPQSGPDALRVHVRFLCDGFVVVA